MKQQGDTVNPPAAGAGTIEAEAFNVLYRIFRTWQQRQALGHDLAITVRSIVRRANPVEYARVMKRWPDTKPSPLPPSAAKE